MKFKVKVPDLQYAAKVVKDVVNSKDETPENKGVLISSKDNVATFTAFGTEIKLQAKIAIDGVEEGTALVDAVAFFSAVSYFKPMNERGVGSEDVTISCSQKSRKLNISTKTVYADGSSTPNRRALPLLDSSIFPDFSSLNKMQYDFSLDSSDLLDSIKSVLFASSSDVNNLLFTGVSMKIKQGLLKTACLNGIILSEFSIPVNTGDKDIDIVLPGKLANKVLSSVYDNRTVNISIHKNNIFFSTPNLIFGGPLISGDFPDYESTITEPTKFLEVPRLMFVENILNLSHDGNEDDDSRVIVEFVGNSCTIKCRQSYNEGIPVKGFDKFFSFDSNFRLLALCSKNVVSDNIKIGFTEPESPVFLYPAEESPRGVKTKSLLVPLKKQV